MADAAPARRAAVDFAWLLGGRLAMAGLALVALRQATALLPTPEFGRLALFIAIQGFAALLVIGPIGQHVTVNFHRWQADGDLWPRARGFLGWVALSGAAGALAGYGVGATTPFALLALFANIAAINLHTQSGYFLNLAGQRRQAVTWGLIGVALGLAAALALATRWPTALAWLAGQALGWLVGALGSGAALRRVTGARTGGAAIARLPLLDRATFLEFCVPLALAALSVWALANGPRFLIQGLWGLPTLGLVAAGLVPAVQLWALVEMLANQLLQPGFFRRLAAGEPAAAVFGDLVNVLGPLYLVLLAAVVAAAPGLLRLLVDPRYAEAGRYLAAGALLEGTRVLAGVFAMAAQATRRTAAVPLPSALGALVSFAGLGLMAGQPIATAIWALPLGGMVALLLMAWRMHRQVAYRLLPGPWLAALLLLGVALLFTRLPLPVTGLAAALTLVTAVGVVAVGALALLLGPAPALRRLLA